MCTATNRDRITQFLSATEATRDEVLSEVRNRISEIDDFELRHAGSTLAVELPSLLSASRKAQQEKLAGQERQRQLHALSGHVSQLGREKHLKERKKREEEKEREAALEAELVRRGYAGLFGG